MMTKYWLNKERGDPGHGGRERSAELKRMNEKCHENMSRTKKELCAEEGHHLVKAMVFQ